MNKVHLTLKNHQRQEIMCVTPRSTHTMHAHVSDGRLRNVGITT